VHLLLSTRGSAAVNVLFGLAVSQGLTSFFYNVGRHQEPQRNPALVCLLTRDLSPSKRVPSDQTTRLGFRLQGLDQQLCGLGKYRERLAPTNKPGPNCMAATPWVILVSPTSRCQQIGSSETWHSWKLP
jgi:hypothetical protein